MENFVTSNVENLSLFKISSNNSSLLTPHLYFLNSRAARVI